MAKCVLGKKKLERCREIGQREYFVGYTRGGWPHFQAECWYEEYKEKHNSADWVNYKTGEVRAYIRIGQFVQQPGIATPLEVRSMTVNAKEKTTNS